MIRDARFSKDGLHRYWLRRQWDPTRPAMASLSVNPSVADATRDDPTIRKDVGFAERWGFGSLWKVNLFTRIATESRDLLTLPRDEWNGPGANETIRLIVRDAARVVIAYGRFDPLKAALNRRALEVRRILRAEVKCSVGTFGRNKDGSPPHGNGQALAGKAHHDIPQTRASLDVAVHLSGLARSWSDLRGVHLVLTDRQRVRLCRRYLPARLRHLDVRKTGRGERPGLQHQPAKPWRRLLLCSS